MDDVDCGIVLRRDVLSAGAFSDELKDATGSGANMTDLFLVVFVMDGCIIDGCGCVEDG